MRKETDNPSNLPAKQARNVIQSFYITTARYDFDITEKRILTAIITALQHLLEGKKLKGLYKLEPSLFDKAITFPTSLIVGTDFNNCNYKQVHQALKKLQSKQLTYEDEKVWVSIPLMGKTTHNKQEGTLTINLYNEIIDLFLNFTKGYSKYIAEVSLSLSSVHSARLYELISNQQNPITYDIEHLKKILGVEKTYPLNGNFLQRVIRPAQKELQAKANWSFDYTTKTQGRQRKITHLTLIPIHHIDREPEEVQSAERERKLSILWYLDSQTKTFLRNVCNFTPREIKNNLKTLEAYLNQHQGRTITNLQRIWKNAQRADNPKGYLIASLQNSLKRAKKKD